MLYYCTWHLFCILCNAILLYVFVLYTWQFCSVLCFGFCHLPQKCSWNMWINSIHVALLYKSHHFYIIYCKWFIIWICPYEWAIRANITQVSMLLESSVRWILSDNAKWFEHLKKCFQWYFQSSIILWCLIAVNTIQFCLIFCTLYEATCYKNVGAMAL